MTLNDNIIESMKEQMVPSDDVINSLLAKINEIDNSSNANVVQFEQPRVKEFKYKAKTPAYKYVASFAACVVVLVSCFSIFGTGDDPEKIQSGIDKIINNPMVVSQPNDEDENDNNKNNESAINNSSDEDENAVENTQDSEKDKNVQKDSINSKNDVNKDSDKNDKVDKDSNKQDNVSKDSSKKDNEVNVASKKPNPVSTQVAIPKASEEPIEETLPEEWTKEILSEEEVSNVVVKGNNYVIGDTASVITTSKISSLSFDVEYEDEVYNVDAVTKEIANVSPDFAVAMTSNDIGGTVVYLNKNYSPKNLGQLANDTGLNVDLSLSKAMLSDNRVGFSPVSSISPAVAGKALRDLISMESGAQLASGYEAKLPYVFMASPGSKNATGVEFNFEVSASGFLRIKIVGGGTYVFNIGVQAAERFIESIQ